MRALPIGLLLLLSACQAQVTLGATCARTSECAAPLVCEFGRCRNQCDQQRDCPVGTTCLLDQDGHGSCALPDDPDCSRMGVGCAAPLACVGRECVNVCTLGVECPPGSQCNPIGDGRARCVRADDADASVADADVPDVGPVDAPRSDAGLCTPAAAVAGPCDVALQIAIGDAFSCVRALSGRIWCWGFDATTARDGDVNGCARVTPSALACPTPTPIRAEDDAMHVGETVSIDSIDAQDTGGCFLTRDAVMSCWGSSGYEAPLGRDIETGERARTVQRVGGGTLGGIDDFFVFDGSAIAIGLDGQWWGWGSNQGDVLGLGAQTAVPLARTIPALVDTHRVYTADHHGCGITSTGTVACWGANEHGQSDPTTPSSTPVGRTVIPGVSNATELAMGRTHSCALAAEGFVCWGWRTNLWVDAAFDAPTCPTTATDCRPTVIPTGSLHIAHLAAVRNADDFCAIDGAGTLYCWGEGYATLGHVPQTVPGLPPVGSAIIEWDHACALSTDSDVWCWGHNELGELGRDPVLPITSTAGAAMVMWP